METLTATLEKYTARAFEPFPDEAQCPTCGYFDVQHPDVRRLIKIRDPHGVQSLYNQCRCKCYRSEDLQKWERYKRETQSLIPGDHTFENFKHFPGTQDMYEAAVNFANRVGPRMLVMVGGTGTGKTHLLSAIGRIVLKQGRSVRYELATQYIERLRHSYSDDQSRGISDLDPAGDLYDMRIWYNRMNTLLIDDVGMERATPFVQEQINTLIDERINTGGWLAMTTNLAKDEINEHLGPRVASRMWAESMEVKMKDQVGVVINTGSDRRA